MGRGRLRQRAVAQGWLQAREALRRLALKRGQRWAPKLALEHLARSAEQARSRAHRKSRATRGWSAEVTLPLLVVR